MINIQNENYIKEKFTKFIENDPRNVLHDYNNMKIYDGPLIGIASANDPYFEEFRKPNIIGQKFILPNEWLPGANSIISFFLPLTKELRDTNRNAGLPSEEWVSERIEGQVFIDAAHAFLVELLKGLDAEAVAPSIDPRFQVEDRISNWSERHIAFAAGLGTFGLHRALITAKGTAGQIGSVITTLSLAPTLRPYTRYDEYCPFLTVGKCGACIRRCPPISINKKGKDNQLCSEYIDREVLSIFSPRYGCGKCNINVPCENKIPVI